MTPKEINIELAKLDGWTRIHEHKGQTFGIIPNAEMMDGQDAPSQYFQIPNYYEDLNEIHRLIKDSYSLGYSRLLFSEYLGKVVKRPGWALFDAESSERCEALLRMHGLWY
jgi:hypothetical protein